MKEKIILLLLSAWLAFPAFGQNMQPLKNSHQLIDSLVKVNDIKLCVAYQNRAVEWNGNPYKFSINGNFLMLAVTDFRLIDKVYYDMNKVVSFYIRKDEIHIYFSN